MRQSERDRLFLSTTGMIDRGVSLSKRLSIFNEKVRRSREDIAFLNSSGAVAVMKDAREILDTTFGDAQLIYGRERRVRRDGDRDNLYLRLSWGNFKDVHWWYKKYVDLEVLRDGEKVVGLEASSGLDDSFKITKINPEEIGKAVLGAMEGADTTEGDGPLVGKVVRFLNSRSTASVK